MSFLYLLEEIRNPILDFFFSIVTLFGEETIFMAVGMVVFWCFNKYQGYYLLCVGFVGTMINQFLKMVFQVPRPWVKDPNFTIVESAREAAGGYSFPSGHTQVSVGLYGGLALSTKNLALRVVSIALCVLVPLSRMYLGVHTPADVLVSVAVALILIFAASPLFKKAEKEPRVMYIILFSLVAAIIAYICFVHFYKFPDSVYSEGLHNLESARKNGFTLLGSLLGFIVAYTADIKWIKFDTKAVWWAQILKTVLGIAIVLAAKELLRFPLDAILPADSWARMLRYFLMVVFGGALWPMTFKYFARLGKKNTK